MQEPPIVQYLHFHAGVGIFSFFITIQIHQTFLELKVMHQINGCFQTAVSDIFNVTVSLFYNGP